MIKLDERKLLELINNNDLDSIKKLVELELYNMDLSITDKKRIDAFKKSAKAQLKNIRENMRGAFIDKDNMITVCSEYYIHRLFTDKIVGCDMVDVEKALGKDCKMFDSAKFMNEAKSSANLKIYLDINDIMIQYKKHKATKEKVINAKNYGMYTISYEGFNGKAYMNFNINYLKEMHDILDFTEEVEFYIIDKSNEKEWAITDEEGIVIEKGRFRENNTPLMIISDSGEGLLLPIRIKDNPETIMSNNKR